MKTIDLIELLFFFMLYNYFFCLWFFILFFYFLFWFIFVLVYLCFNCFIFNLYFLAGMVIPMKFNFKIHPLLSISFYEFIKNLLNRGGDVKKKMLHFRCLIHQTTDWGKEI